MSFTSAQAYMREKGMDGWLICDFRGSNSVFAQLLPGRRFTTRRLILWVPAAGEPVLLAHQLDAGQFASAGITIQKYVSWRDLESWLASTLRDKKRIAMEYSPKCGLPVISIVDAGTIELVRTTGVEVVSSADLVQVTVARWSSSAVDQHLLASTQVAEIKDRAFDMIRQSCAAGKPVNELEVQQFILSLFAEAGLETPDPPIVAVNAHSGDPHFEVSIKDPARIRRGDWVLIDLWARRPGDENIFSDITWTGYVGQQVPQEHRRVFDIVRGARDAALDCAVAAWRAGRQVAGWQLDQAAMDRIIAAGFGDYIRHRTGHSLSPGPKVHGMGMNLDNLETRDIRAMLPETGFTIEPGIYLPGFGVRSEINVYVDPKRGPVVTSCLQTEPVLM